jgi:glutaminyl-tRNA synthetase
MNEPHTSEAKPLDFIRQIVARDRQSGKHPVPITRFPPEPNGFLHIGHAKSICLNFGIAGEFQGRCHLRFDDTNPTKEEEAYVTSIKEDVRWLGFDWGEHLYFASDYFEQLYQFAEQLIEQGNAYVCDLSAEQIRQLRGTLTEPGTNSPYRDRPVSENLDLFRRMRAGEFDDGSRVLRAKIDMGSPVVLMRDPVLYRILRAHHHRTGDRWCIYPMYDFTHCLSDMLESITHSLCTLEFQDNRALYDWVLDTLHTPIHPRQYEFARLNLSFTVMSKRKLRLLIENGLVDGWDDPRMLTISGLRRRGYTPRAIRGFCEEIGVGKKQSWIDMGVLENAVRNDLNEHAPRAMAVLKPLRVIIDNYPDDQVEMVTAANHPKRPELGNRELPFSREILIEQDDFMEDPPTKFFRLGPGREVRLRYGYNITCTGYEKDPETGEISVVHCTYDPASKGGTPEGRKVKGVIHWLSAAHARPCAVVLYDRLFMVEDPESDKETEFTEHLNPDSRRLLQGCYMEPALADLPIGKPVQFERQGYFCKDQRQEDPLAPLFNRTVTLRDSWAKLSQK